MEGKEEEAPSCAITQDTFIERWIAFYRVRSGGIGAKEGSGGKEGKERGTSAGARVDGTRAFPLAGRLTCESAIMPWTGWWKSHPRFGPISFRPGKVAEKAPGRIHLSFPSDLFFSSRTKERKFLLVICYFERAILILLFERVSILKLYWFRIKDDLE